MCELFGVSSAQEVPIQSYLQTFFQHSVRHPHGWGLMRYRNKQREIYKEPVCAVKSGKLEHIIQTTPAQKTAMAHIRLATVGSIKPENCHPYCGVDSTGRTWTLIHNGTIYSGNRLTPYYNTQKGDTDSERIFLYLLDEINHAAAICGHGHHLCAKQRFTVVERLVTLLASRNKLNLILYDGELLYVHKNMQDTLFVREIGTHGLMFATVPLDDGTWQPVPMTRLAAFHDGEKVFEGTKHPHIFIPPLDSISPMDAMHI